MLNKKAKQKKKILDNYYKDLVTLIKNKKFIKRY